MKITSIRTKAYQYELSRKIGDVNFPEGRRHSTSLAVFVETDGDLTGVSISQPLAEESIKSLASVLVGEDPRGVKGLWRKMVDCVFKGGNRGLAGDALSSLDVALWDLKAKANGEPLWRTLGASSPKVKAYASGIDTPLDDDELQTFYERMAGMGISAGKLKVGLDQDTDIRRIGIMKDALSRNTSRPLLAIDANEYWSPKQAIRNVREIEEHFDITWVEEPARRWDYRGLRRVSQNVKASVATGENLDEIGDFMPLIAGEAVDIVEIGFGASGITGGMQVAHMAYGFEIPVCVMNSPGNITAHMAAALPNHMMLEVVDCGRDHGFSVDSRIEDGWIVLGETPGLGLVFDEKVLDASRVDVTSLEPALQTGFPAGRRKGAGL